MRSRSVEEPRKRESVERFCWLGDPPGVESVEMVLDSFAEPHATDMGTFEGNGHRGE